MNFRAYRTSVGSMGGRSLIPVSAEVRKAAGVAAGDELAVEEARADATRRRRIIRTVEELRGP